MPFAGVGGGPTCQHARLGCQLGGEAYRQIIYFEDQSAFKEFTNGNVEFAAQAQVVAISTGASAATTTTGTAVGANVSGHGAKNVASSHKGLPFRSPLSQCRPMSMTFFENAGRAAIESYHRLRFG